MLRKKGIGMTNIYALISVTALLINIILVVFTSVTERKNVVGRALITLILSFIVWDVGELMRRLRLDNPLFWSKVECAGVLFIPPAFYHFVTVFPEDTRSRLRRASQKYLLVAFYCTSFAFLPLLLGGKMISGVEYRFWGYEYTGTPLLTAFQFYFIGVMFVATFELFRSYKFSKDDKFEFLQVRAVAPTALTVVVLGVLTDVLLPLNKNFIPLTNVQVPPLASAFTAAGATVVAYVLLKYRYLPPEVMLDSLVKSVEDGFIVTDRFGRIQLVNAFVEELFGVESKKIVGRTLKDLEAVVKDEARELIRVISGLEELRKIVELPNVVLEVIVSPIMFKGALFGHLVELRDISKLVERERELAEKTRALEKQTEELKATVKELMDARRALLNILEDVDASKKELAEAYERLKEIDEMKNNFMIIAIHELGTPLTIIRGNVDMLLSGVFGELSYEQQERLLVINESVNRLMKLLDDLRAVMTIKEGRLRLDRRECSIKTLVHDVVRDLSAFARQKGHTLRVDVPDVKVTCDVEKVKSVIYNLLDNAIKFTPEGGSIEITAEEISDAESGKNYVKFCVADTGVGIPKDELPKIFEAFYEVGGYLSHRRGMGVGLFVVRSVIEAHGGRVWAESEVGRGSRFFFTLPK
ncbi:MAG TPA: PAS domain S-box protein [Methanomicrobia archaeon]|nr:PAS domain S-box protein [Methanomicrobia archaeon]HEX59813.1 PAS domain S-box protein [Methanomicrobia archaeon]